MTFQAVWDLRTSVRVVRCHAEGGFPALPRSPETRRQGGFRGQALENIRRERERCRRTREDEEEGKGKGHPVSQGARYRTVGTVRLGVTTGEGTEKKSLGVLGDLGGGGGAGGEGRWPSPTPTADVHSL